MSGLDCLNLSGAGLAARDAPGLAEQLRKFPALKQLDLSANPGLDRAAVSFFLNSLSSKAYYLKRHICVQSLLSVLFCVLTAPQGLHIFTFSTSATLALRACPMTFRCFCPGFEI